MIEQQAPAVLPMVLFFCWPESGDDAMLKAAHHGMAL
jgi:hypothetical protein